MILVTGGAGFIGANFVLDWLAQSDEPIVNVDKLSYAGNLENLRALQGDARHHFVQADIADQALIGQILAQYQPRAVLHFAAESHVDRSIAGAGAFIQSNIVGTFALLEAVRLYWAQLPVAAQTSFRWLHVSTDEVFGSLAAAEKPFTEDSRYAPNSPYAASKAASDHLVRAWHQTYGLPVITTHCSNNYGPMQFPEKLIPVVLSRALAGKPLPLYGDGLQVRDWLYVADHCSALRHILAAGAVGATYNIGGQCEMSNLALVQTLCRMLDQLQPSADGMSYARQITHVPDRLGHDRRYAIDARKLQQELAWTPSHDLESGLWHTVQWYLSHRDWVDQAMAQQAQTASRCADHGANAP